MAKTRVAIIGHTGKGNYGHGLDTIWKQFEDIDVVAVADPDEAGRTAALKRTTAQRPYADYRQMLDKERPEIVAVCPRWTDQHRDMALVCAEFGCHMFMEKPLCRTMGEADEIIKACEMRHLKLAVAHIARYSPQLLIAKQVIHSGEIGDVLEIRARGKEDARGGSEDLWVLGSHALNIMQFFGGELESCYATLHEKGQRVTNEHVHPGNEGLGPLAGDRVDAMYRFKTGITGYFSSQKAAGGSSNRFGVRVLGSKGLIDIPSGYGRPLSLLKDPLWGSARTSAKWQTISSTGIDQPETLTATDYEGALPVCVRDLRAAIAEDRQPICSMYDARTCIEMILAVFDSHRVGQAVTFPLKNKENALGQL